MSFPPLPSSRIALSRATTTAESIFLTVLPHGGQGTARRNAWRAMSYDVSEARARREAEAAVERAAARAASRAAAEVPHPVSR